jgi:formylglycine-generating enzyme required for sulfatase activity
MWTMHRAAGFAFLIGCRSPAAIATAPDASAPADAADEAWSDVVEASAPEGMLRVPAGTFTMGADHGGEEDERPAHAVTLAAFWLDRVPVTNDAYAACVHASACPALGPRDPKYTRPEQPVNTVTWDGAKAYCAFAGKRLPREAEYERAMRGDDGRTYAWGNADPTPERAAYGRPLDAGSTDDVGSHPAGRGPFGHDDLAGNVWEWVDDAYDPYAYRRKTADRGVPGTCPEILATQDELRLTNREGFTGSNPIPRECEHVLRGGAFNYEGLGLRATNRVHHPGRFRLVMAGFRCAKDE